MNNEIRIFKNPQFGQIRICVDEQRKEWFCLSDVCKALEIGNPSQLKKRLQKRGLIINDTPTQNQHGAVVCQPMTYIDEANLYRCIFQSRKAEAEKFQNWVFEEVLPQIRQTGGYIPVNEEDDEKMILAKAVGIYQRTIEQKDRLIAEQRPKVLFADAVTSGDDSILISEMAKLLTQNGFEIGRTRFFRWLRENGYIFKQSTEPIQKWVERGIFVTHVTLINTHHGQQERITTKVTGKGQEYFINLFITNGTGI